MQPLDPNAGRPRDAPRKPQRQIHFSERFEEVAFKALDEYERLDDVIRTFRWLLEKQPGVPPSEELVDGFWLIDSRALKTVGGDVIPRAILIYRFTDDSVEFWDMEVLPPDP